MKSESLESTDFKLSDLKPSLIIGYDGKRAAQNFTGLGNYSRYIVTILASHYQQNKLVLYSPRSFPEGVSATLNKLKGVVIRIAQSRLPNSWWRSFGIVNDLKKDHIQIFHGLSNELPFGLKKAGIYPVVTIHDLIFLRFPRYYHFLDLQIYRFKFRYACEQADRIIAISEQTKRDIVDFFKIPDSRIQVVYQNCDRIYQQQIARQDLIRIRDKYALPAKYLLSVGTIEPRKNLMLIVQALLHLKNDVHLVVVGRETRYAQFVKEFIVQNNLSARVHFLKKVLQEDLPGIYKQSEVFIFPSRFEGFGIPILEALHSGVPVIAASGSSLEEAGGPGSLYIHPDDEEGLSTSINLILNNPDLRTQMITSGKEYVKRFADEKIAKQIMDIYNNLINDVKRGS